MDIHEAISTPHDLTEERLVAFSRHVGLEADALVRSTLLTGIVNINGGNNHLTPGLDYLRGRIGVYAFQLGACVIYVGKNGGGDQDLKTRIGQQLRGKSQDGGTLPGNWFRKHNLAPEDHEKEYKAVVAQCRLWTVAFPQSGDTQKIAQLEHLLIGVLGPEYCDMASLQADSTATPQDP